MKDSPTAPKTNNVDELFEYATQKQMREQARRDAEEQVLIPSHCVCMCVCMYETHRCR